MPNLHYFKNPANDPFGKRFVFKIEVPSAQPSGQAPSLRVEHQKETNENLNVETRFSADSNDVFEKLGKEAQKTNPALNPESIRRNFVDTLEQGKTIEDAWAYLQSKDCQTAAIVAGLLRFFAGPVGTKEISLSEFFKPLDTRIGREGTLTSKYLQMRQKFLSDSMQSLAALKGELPELPPNKNS